MNDDELNQRELTGDDALRFARFSGMEYASETRGLFLAGVGDLIRFARLVRAGWEPKRTCGVLGTDPAALLRELVEADKAWRSLHPVGSGRNVMAPEERLSRAWKAAEAHVAGVLGTPKEQS
jgi:hypothetical protein